MTWLCPTAPQVHRADDYIDFADETASFHGVSFWELSHLARAAGSIVLGYIVNSRGSDGEAEVVLNPPAKDKLIRFTSPPHYTLQAK